MNEFFIRGHGKFNAALEFGSGEDISGTLHDVAFAPILERHLFSLKKAPKRSYILQVIGLVWMNTHHI